MKPMGRCKNFAMPTRAQRARKKQLAEPSKIPATPRGDPSSDAPSGDDGGQPLTEVIEHPLILAILLVIGGAVGVLLFAPALLICEACVLLALHGSKLVDGRGKAFQATTYGILFLLTTPLILGLGIAAKKPARDYLHQIASRPVSTPAAPTASAPALPASNPLPAPGGFLNFPAAFPTPENATNPASPNNAASIPDAPPAPPNSPEAALMKQMRDKLSQDAGDPKKIGDDVQWMRDQFAAGWPLEPPESANKHRAETEQTERLILANANDREAILKLIPHITIDK